MEFRAEEHLEKDLAKLVRIRVLLVRYHCLATLVTLLLRDRKTQHPAGKLVSSLEETLKKLPKNRLALTVVILTYFVASGIVESILTYLNTRICLYTLRQECKFLA